MGGKTTMVDRAEMAVIKTEVKYIKKTLDEICPMINNMHSTFIKGEGKIRNNYSKIVELNKQINGNGNPGLRQDVQQIKSKLQYYAGGMIVIMAVLQIVIAVYF